MDKSFLTGYNGRVQFLLLQCGMSAKGWPCKIGRDEKYEMRKAEYA